MKRKSKRDTDTYTKYSKNRNYRNDYNSYYYICYILSVQRLLLHSLCTHDNYSKHTHQCHHAYSASAYSSLAHYHNTPNKPSICKNGIVCNASYCILQSSQ